MISSRLLSPAVRCTLGKHLCRKRETNACILVNRVQVENRGGVSASPMIFLVDCNQLSFLSTLNFVFAETPSCSYLLAQKMAVQSDFLDTQTPLLLRIWGLAPRSQNLPARLLSYSLVARSAGLVECLSLSKTRSSVSFISGTEPVNSRRGTLVALSSDYKWC